MSHNTNLYKEGDNTTASPETTMCCPRELYHVFYFESNDTKGEIPDELRCRCGAITGYEAKQMTLILELFQYPLRKKQENIFGNMPII